jgi:hypothetical protein
MSVGRTITEAVSVFRQNVFALLVIGAIVFVPVDLVTAWIDETRGWESESAGRLALFTVVLLLGWTLAYGAAIAAVAVEPEGAEEEPRTPLAALGDAGRCWYTLLAIVVLGGLAVLGGLVLLIVPGVVLLTWWFVAFQPALIESRGWRESLGRSRELVRGSFWPVLALVVVLSLGLAALDYAVYRVATAALPDFLGAWAGGVVADTLGAGASAALTTAAFWELRAPPLREG